MSGTGKHIEAVRIKKEPGQDEADSSSNSASSNAAEPTRQSSLQRIQLRKERVWTFLLSCFLRLFHSKMEHTCKFFWFVLFCLFNSLLFSWINYHEISEWPSWACTQRVKLMNAVVRVGKRQTKHEKVMWKTLIYHSCRRNVEIPSVNTRWNTIFHIWPMLPTNKPMSCSVPLSMLKIYTWACTMKRMMTRKKSTTFYFEYVCDDCIEKCIEIRVFLFKNHFEFPFSYCDNAYWHGNSRL